MPLFKVAIILPKDTQDTKTAIDELLAPYDQWLELPEYETNCMCVSFEATQFGIAVANKTVKEAVELEHIAANLPLDQFFYDDVWGEYQSVAEQAARSHPSYAQAHPDCEYCRGTRRVKSTFNANGMWEEWGYNVEHAGGKAVQDLPAGFTCLVIVTPDGTWHQPSKETRTAYNRWRATAAGLFLAYSDYPVAIIDCYA